METIKSDAERAEELSRKRPRILTVLAVLFLSQQAANFSHIHTEGRSVDHVRVAAWLVMSLVLIAALVTGGGWLHPRRVRELANDETTRAFRANALSVGFVFAMLGSVAVYFLDFYQPMTGREAAHLIMSAGILAAILRFAFLERRAERDA